MSHPMSGRLLVTGSRDWTDAEAPSKTERG